MKIGIINEILSRVSGTSLQTCALARHLCEKGHEVHIIALGELSSQLDIGNAVFHSAGPPAKQLMNSEEIMWSFADFVLQLNHDIAFDIFHVHYCTAIMVAVINRVIHNTPFVINLHGYELSACLTSSLHLYAMRCGIALASAVIAVSRATLQEMSNAIPLDFKKTAVIPDGLIIENENACLQSKKIKQLCDDMFTFIYIGRLVKEKGLIELITAFKIHLLKYPDSMLLIVGDGPLSNIISNYVHENSMSNNVIMIGQIAHHSIFSYLKISDMFILPSYNEGLGSVITEALYCEIPVIATKVGGIVEIIDNKKNGLLIKPNSVDAIVCALNLVRDDPLFLANLKSKSKASVGRYMWSSIVKQIEEIYLKCISNTDSDMQELRSIFSNVYNNRNPYI